MCQHAARSSILAIYVSWPAAAQKGWRVLKFVDTVGACFLSIALAGSLAVPAALADEPAQEEQQSAEESQQESAEHEQAGHESSSASSAEASGEAAKKSSSKKKSNTNKSKAKKATRTSKKGTSKTSKTASSSEQKASTANTSELLKEARSAEAKAESAASKIAEPREALESASAALVGARTLMKSLKKTRTSLELKTARSAKQAVDAQKALESVDSLIKEQGAAGLIAKLEDGLSVDTASHVTVYRLPSELPPSREEILVHSVSETVKAVLPNAGSLKPEQASKKLERKLGKAQRQQKKLKKRSKACQKRIKTQAKAQSSAIAEGNRNAFAVEKHASDSRVFDERASDAVDKLSGATSSEVSLIASVRSAKESHSAQRESAAETVSAWYDLVDDLSDRKDAISFGEGIDFLMDRDEFVEKWGAAITQFYEGRVLEAGEYCPLVDYGDYMAGCAYDYAIDPRLCAAVSIIESSGGIYCIRPHNAWGWGAADSDPYNLASEWGSWEEGIKAWHYGVSHSTTGLADAGTLDEFGAIYCSSADWSANVAKCMQKISDYADALS